MGITYQNEGELASLPVPSLISTAEKLLAALKPLVLPGEYQQLVERSVDFVNSELVQSLQQTLLKASESRELTYLDAPGISTSTPGIYGELRGNTLPRNPFFILEDDPLSKTAQPPSQAFRAAVLVTSALRFICALRQELVTPDVAPKSGRPLSMESYRHLFGTARVPVDLDGRHTGVGIKKAAANDSRHIVVLSHSQLYVLEVLTEAAPGAAHMLWFTKYELKALLEEIIRDSEATDEVEAAKQSIGAFTTESRPTWRLARRNLDRNSPGTLDVVDSALFVLCLDHEAPRSDAEKVQLISHGTSRLRANGIQAGTCTSRWYDKLQVVVTQNAVAGVIWESTSMDGTAVLRFISDVYTDSVLRLARKINGQNYTLWPKGETVRISDDVEKPVFSRLRVQLTPEMQTGLHLAETRLADLISQHDYVTTTVRGFGNELIGGRMRLSADSLFQVCVQIALYALYGRVPSSSEPISTRRFRGARTEPITVQSDAVLRCCQEFITQATPERKWQAVLDACEDHRRKVLDALDGRGFERHLSALRSAYIQRPQAAVPPLIFEPAVDALYKPELLIANCGNPALHLFGVTPAVPGGFGVGYIIKDDHIAVCASSQWRQTERFLSTLNYVVDEVKACWRAAAPAERGGSRARELDGLVSSLPMDLVASNASEARSTDYILGGYDYFDVAALETRSELVSRIVSRSASSSDVRDQRVGRRVVLQDEA